MPDDHLTRTCYTRLGTEDAHCLNARSTRCGSHGFQSRILGRDNPLFYQPADLPEDMGASTKLTDLDANLLRDGGATPTVKPAAAAQK
mgnify:CR=1 FL=1